MMKALGAMMMMVGVGGFDFKLDPISSPIRMTQHICDVLVVVVKKRGENTHVALEERENIGIFRCHIFVM